MDPGATVMDEGAAQALFDETLEAWLRERLGGVRQPDDLLVALYLDRSDKTRELLGEIARHLQRHRDSDVPDMARLDDVLADLRIAVQRFRDFLHTLKLKLPHFRGRFDLGVATLPLSPAASLVRSRSVSGSRGRSEAAGGCTSPPRS